MQALMQDKAMAVARSGGPFRLTIAMAAYNEARDIGTVLRTFMELEIEADWELLVVDDGSDDGTGDIAEAHAVGALDGRLRVVRHPRNLGKGAAIRTVIAQARGTHLLVFDADSEYDPADIVRLVEPVRRGRAEVVYGVRARGFDTLHPTFVHGLGNLVMTMAANLVFGSWISDLHTCLKLLPLPLLRAMCLRETGFGLDTEITAEMLRLGFRPYEVPVSYVGRSSDEGKKVGFGDALRSFWLIAKVRARGAMKRGERDRSLAPAVSFGQAPGLSLVGRERRASAATVGRPRVGRPSARWPTRRAIVTARRYGEPVSSRVH